MSRFETAFLLLAILLAAATGARAQQFRFHLQEATIDDVHRAIREELNAEVHGEVDEKSWHLKQALLRRQTNVRKETKLFREYARQAFEDLFKK